MRIRRNNDFTIMGVVAIAKTAAVFQNWYSLIHYRPA